MDKKTILISGAMLTAAIVAVVLVSRQRRKNFDKKCLERGGTVVKSGSHCNFKS